MVDVAVSATLTDQQGVASVAKVRFACQIGTRMLSLTCAQLPNKQYIIAFESRSNTTGSSQVRFKTTATPENADTASVREITTASGAKPQGAPFATWSPIGGTNGTIILSDSTTNSIFTNQALGEGPWKVIPTKAGRAFGREARACKLLHQKVCVDCAN